MVVPVLAPFSLLTKIANRVERQFYEIEANAQGWSVPQLQRQLARDLRSGSD